MKENKFARQWALAVSETKVTIPPTAVTWLRGQNKVWPVCPNTESNVHQWRAITRTKIECTGCGRVTTVYRTP